MTTLFICWSGARSRAVAGIMARRLPAIVPHLECLVSTQIEPGTLWSTELQRQLDAADAGLVCLTPEAVGSPWIHYEAGLLAAEVRKERGEPTIFTYLLGLEPRSLTGPLSAYQPATAGRADTARLVDSLLRFAGAEPDMDYDTWWSGVTDELAQIPPVPLDDVVPDLERLFRSQTFIEPMRECADQRWLARYSKAREVFGRLDHDRSRVRAACRPAVADVYDELCRLVEGYAMDLKTYFLVERRFDPDEETGLLQIKPGAALSADRRRADVMARLSQLVEAARAPLMDESPRFGLTKSFSTRKDLIHKKTAEIEAARLAGGRPVLAAEDFERAAFSDWAFDRIVLYLILERVADVSVADALRGVTVELEKLRAQSHASPSHMPLHYALGPLKPVTGALAPDAPDAIRIERALHDVERQIEGRDEGGQISETIREIRELLTQFGTSGTTARGAGGVALLRQGPAAWNARREEGGEDLSHLQIRNADLRGADLRGVDFDGTEFVNVDLSGADLAGARLNGVVMERVRMEGSTLEGAECKGTDLDRVCLRRARLDALEGFELKVRRSDLTATTLRGARLRASHIYNCDMTGSDCSGLRAEGVTLKRVVGSPEVLDVFRSMGALVELANEPRADDLVDWDSVSVPDRRSGPAFILQEGRTYWFSVDRWDFFVSHATADKESFARPLARALEHEGQRVWLDAGEVKPGDMLDTVIGYGARAANFGVAILSPRFLGREWTDRELELLEGERLFVVLHDGFTLEELQRRRPSLRSRVTLSSEPGPAAVARQLVDAIGRAPGEM
jgi:hypothetical protein